MGDRIGFAAQVFLMQMIRPLFLFYSPSILPKDLATKDLAKGALICTPSRLVAGKLRS